MFHEQLNQPQPCPCGSGRLFSDCCEPALQGIRPAPTAEALMRSRYTAFALGAIDYLIDTLAPEQRQPGEAELLAEQVQTTRWVGLRILSTERGQASDRVGKVAFEAHFEAGNERGVLSEVSRFRREGAHWFYVDGDVDWRPG